MEAFITLFWFFWFQGQYPSCGRMLVVPASGTFACRGHIVSNALKRESWLSFSKSVTVSNTNTRPRLWREDGLWKHGLQAWQGLPRPPWHLFLYRRCFVLSLRGAVAAPGLYFSFCLGTAAYGGVPWCCSPSQQSSAVSGIIFDCTAG